MLKYALHFSWKDSASYTGHMRFTASLERQLVNVGGFRSSYATPEAGPLVQ
jgi:hypothetical protein